MIKGWGKADQPAVRISDADRDFATDRLREAGAEGRLTIDELESRLDAVHTAVFADDLREPLAGLPGGVVATLGRVESNVPARPATGGPHFIVAGHTRMGSVAVRRRRQFAGLRF